MKRRVVHPVVLAILVLAAVPSCAPRPRDEGAAGCAGSEADRAAIVALRDAYVAAHNAADVDRLMDLWTDDAVILPIDEPEVVGKEAVREHYQDFMDQVPTTIAIDSVETQIACDWAWERANVTVTIPSGPPSHLRAKYIFILRRQPDGAWKFARAIYNLDESYPEPDSASSTS